ncbi:MAG: hypothetical protein IKT32_04845 [Clostridia bacterium]|nr:hypothetical protein [Clostridia bacterium]
MKKLIANTLMAWACGFGLGLLLGFGNAYGIVYYDITSGLCAGAFFGGVFAVACWIVGCKELGENDE